MVAKEIIQWVGYLHCTADLGLIPETVTASISPQHSSGEF